MKCKICGAEIDSDYILCQECREKVENLSRKIVSDRKSINLKFTEHHEWEKTIKLSS